MKCLGCGTEKDFSVKEFYPYIEEGIVQDEPIDPLLILDCQGPRIPNHPQNFAEFKTAVVCHACFHKLSPDMWIDQRGWESISPVTPYEKLPPLEYDNAGHRHKIEHYSLSAR